MHTRKSAHLEWWELIKCVTLILALTRTTGVSCMQHSSVLCLWFGELNVSFTDLNTTQQLLINADSLGGSWYHISQSGIRSMKGWCSAVQSCGHVGKTASVSRNLYCAFIRTLPVFNQAAKHFNEPQAFIVPLNLSCICICQGQSAHNYCSRALSAALLFSAEKHEERLITDCLRLHSCFCHLNSWSNHT